MIIEHTIFFLLGAASVKTAEIFLRILVSHAYNKTRRSSHLTRTKNTIAAGEERHYDKEDNITNGDHHKDNDSKSSIMTTTIRVWSKVIRIVFSLNSKYQLLWLLIPIFLVAVWHWPPLFDYAVVHENIHILQHISFLVVGITGFIALRTLGESFKIIILITLNAVMAFTGLLFSVTTDPLYNFYSVNDHNQAGTYMLVTCIVLLVIGLPVYLVHRTLFYIRIKIKEKGPGLE